MINIGYVVGTLARGGAEKQLLFMARAAKDLGMNPEFLCLTAGEAYEPKARSLGIPIKYVGRSKNRLLRLGKIIRAVREMDAAIIQSSHFYTNIYAGAAGRYLGIPSIGAVRSDLDYEVSSHRLTGYWQIALPDLLVTNSDIARRRLLARGVEGERIEFVRNAVTIEEPPPKADGRKGMTILFVGRLDANKRPDRFIRLAATLTEKYADLELQFQIAGSGEARKELEALAARLGLGPSRLVFLGDRADMEEVYRDADILVSTSDQEGTPNVVLEAMANGLPVVATAVGGTRDLLADGRGSLVERNDENALVRAVEYLVLNSGSRSSLGLAGRRYVCENHSPEYLTNRLDEIYTRLCSPAKKRRYTGSRAKRKKGAIYES